MNKPNVFFVVLDAVRPDHLSCYGYARKTTPNIDKIAQEGVLFENAFSAAPWTPPSHASMFTGMYPSQHGVLGETLYLNEEVPTIAEILSSEEYETFGICVNPWVSAQTGLQRGFKKFISTLSRHHLDRFPSRLSLDWITFCLETNPRFLLYNWTYQVRLFQKIKRWILNSQKRKKPFFIFVNYLDAHTPYDPPQPFRGKFEEIHIRNTNLHKIRDVFNSRHGYPYAAKQCEISEEEWDTLRSWYDGEIAYIDFFLGRVFDYLKQRELYDNTVIVITSDHGENFGEHQLANHVFCLYDTLLHVPLIIRDPRHSSAGKRVSSLVSHVDLFPTLTSILNIETKSSLEISGVNLIPFENEVHDRYVCAEYGPPVADIRVLKRLSSNVNSAILDRYNRSLKCIRSLDFKYIVASNGDEELYNLEKDPEESENLLYKLPKKAKELELLLKEELKGRPIRSRRATFDDKVRKRLKELGYF